MNPQFEPFRQQIIHPWKFRFFLLQRLPAAFFAGLRIRAFDAQQAVITVRYKWFNQNPFRSMYFAIQSMAAEMSTGLLGFAQIYGRKPGISMLVVKVEGHFSKKVTDLVAFTCTDGAAIIEAVEATILDGEARTVVCTAVGMNTAGEEVAVFYVTWSFKAKTTGTN